MAPQNFKLPPLDTKKKLKIQLRTFISSIINLLFITTLLHLKSKNKHFIILNNKNFYL
jgi:hypothetical protein